MRSGQQNKRGRGRNNNNNSGRKGGSPLSRTYDSTGPDVKIRGNAQHIADKYSSMARDALGSGDTVMAENYLQHAEHYNRIIASAQAQMQERYQREERDRGEQPAAEPQGDAAAAAETERTEVVVDGTGPQPVISGTPAEMAIDEDNAQSPGRRQPARRRAAARPRRPRGNIAPVENSDGSIAAEAGEGETAILPETRPAAGETQDAAPEVVAAAPEA